MYSWLGTLKCKPIDGSGVALDASATFYEASFEVICRDFLHPNKRWIMDNVGLVSVVNRNKYTNGRSIGESVGEWDTLALEIIISHEIYANFASFNSCYKNNK